MARKKKQIAARKASACSSTRGGSETGSCSSSCSSARGGRSWDDCIFAHLCVRREKEPEVVARLCVRLKKKETESFFASLRVVEEGTRSCISTCGWRRRKLRASLHLCVRWKKKLGRAALGAVEKETSCSLRGSAQWRKEPAAFSLSLIFPLFPWSGSLSTQFPFVVLKV